MDLDSLPGSEISMELDPNGHMNFRTYPSISDYYNASSTNRNKPIQLQPGLSNYSSLVLGDDRITFSESIMSATYRVAVEDKMAIDSPSKSKTKHSRRRDYQEAHDKVGDLEIDRLERLMKDKLLQRSKMTSSPFQVRKAFKFFDREGVGKIHIEGFTRALEFLGFQFSEVQNMALFARYDTTFSGEIDYMSFIAKAMMYDPIGVDELANSSAHRKKSVANSSEDYDEAPDIDPNEVRIVRPVMKFVELDRLLCFLMCAPIAQGSPAKRVAKSFRQS
jgi:hypothetical protein